MSENGSVSSETSRRCALARRRGDEALRADLKASLDGELSRARQWFARWHIARCPECREEVTWLKRLGEDMKDLEQATPRPELRARILANLPDVPPHQAAEAGGLDLVPRPLKAVRGGLARRNAPRLALGGAMAALALGGVFAMNRLNAPPVPPKDIPNTGRQAGTGTPNGGSDADLQPSATNSETHLALGPGNAGPDNPTTEPNPARSANPGSVAAEADRLAQKRLAEMARQDQKRRQSAKAQGPKPGQPSPHPADSSVRLALAVGDVPAARERLQQLAQQMGGTFEAASANGASGPSAPPPGSNQATPPKVAVALPVVTLRVPADRLPALRATLSAMGTVRELSVGKRPDNSAKEHAAPSPAETAVHPPKMRPPLPGSATPFVTVTVQLEK